MSDIKDPKDQEEKKEQQEPKEETKKDLDNLLGQLKESDEGEKPKKQEEEEQDVPFKQPRHDSDSDPEGLDGILDQISEKEEEEPVEGQNVIQRVINVFINPSALFAYLRRKPDFFTPLILTVLISLGASYFVYDIALNEQVVRFEQNDRIPDEQKDIIIDRIEESRYGVKRIIYSIGLPILSVIVIYLLISAIFLFIGNILLGGKAKYKQIMASFGYAYLIPVILGTLVKLPLMLQRQTIKIDMSPAIFISKSSVGNGLFNFISSFDIFTLWFLIVFGIGFAIIYRFSQLKGIVSVFIAWLIYVVLFKVLLGSFLSGFGA